MVFFPKNKFQKVVSFAFERSLPTLQYFVWNPMTYYARRSGWTEQEKLYNNFFRGDNIMYHSYAQSLHPLAFNERQRADNFFRRVETLIPGITAPEWAQHHRRAVDFDFEGAMNTFKAINIVDQESTPKPHYGQNYPSAVSHVGNQRFMLGYWAQRLFFNEELRGNLQRGYYTEGHKKVLNSWYANTDDNEVLRYPNRTEQEWKEEEANCEKWIKNIETFYPEYKNYKVPVTPERLNEPYYMRNVEDITNAIFIQNWTNALEKNTFTKNEVQGIYEFYLHQRDEVFWTLNEEDGVYNPTDLYKKYVKTLNLPNIFELEKYSATVVDNQYRDKLQHNYSINFSTVEAYKRQHLKFLGEISERKDWNTLDLKRVRSLITEEVYNPLFRTRIAGSAKGATGSYVVAALKEKSLDDLENVHRTVVDEYTLLIKRIKKLSLVELEM